MTKLKTEIQTKSTNLIKSIKNESLKTNHKKQILLRNCDASRGLLRSAFYFRKASPDIAIKGRPKRSSSGLGRTKSLARNSMEPPPPTLLLLLLCFVAARWLFFVECFRLTLKSQRFVPCQYWVGVYTLLGDQFFLKITQKVFLSKRTIISI